MNRMHLTTDLAILVWRSSTERSRRLKFHLVSSRAWYGYAETGYGHLQASHRRENISVSSELNLTASPICMELPLLCKKMDST